jgi:hypothetical protein
MEGAGFNKETSPLYQINEIRVLELNMIGSIRSKVRVEKML